MRELDRRIATLRLRLAEIHAREDELRSLHRQFKGQLDRLMDFAVFDHGDLASALSMAGEVEARLAATDQTLRHLERIKARGQEELDALLLTSSIEAAKADVASLEVEIRQVDAEIQRLQGSGDAATPDSARVQTSTLADARAKRDQLDAEVRRLRKAIGEASDEAARTVAERSERNAGRSGGN